MIWVLSGIIALLTAALVADRRPRTGSRQLAEWEIEAGVAPRAHAPPPAASHADMAALQLRVAELELQVKGLPGLWKEEADRANRAAEREEKARSRHRQRRASEEAGPDNDAERADVETGGSQSVLALHPNLAGAPDHAAVISQTRRALAIQQLASGSKGR